MRLLSRFLFLLAGPFFFAAVSVLISAALASSLTYMGGDVGTLMETVIQTQPLLAAVAVIKLLAFLLIVSVFFWVLHLGLPFWLRGLFLVALSVAFLVRQASLYPAMFDSIEIFHQSSGMRNVLLSLAMLSKESLARTLVDFLPLILLSLALCGALWINWKQRSRGYVLIQLACAALIMPFFNPNLTFSVPRAPKSSDAKPHVFVFGIDSLRADYVLDPQYREILPNLQRLKDSSWIADEMLVGIPRTFPSWVEMMTCKYGISNGVRSMFPPRKVRLGHVETLPSLLDTRYFSTVTSDFAGDIFPRYPFGFRSVDTPTSDLPTLLENGLIGALPALRAVLVMPRLVHFFPALFESAEFADPRLVVWRAAKQLEKVTDEQALFQVQFFSTSHFPYATPAPDVFRYQLNTAREKLLFKRDPDQAKQLTGTPAESATDATAVIALYRAALHATDATLQDYLNELSKKGWLTNAVVVILGDHGENLFDGNLGMGHGDGVSGEHATTTALLISLNGIKAPTFNRSRVIKSVDLAPTLLDLTRNKRTFKSCDGHSLAQGTVTGGSAYQESGVWFTATTRTPEGKSRVQYPSVVHTVELDVGMRNEFVLDRAFAPTILTVKERAWVNQQYRLLTWQDARTQSVALFDRRKDPLSQVDLLQGATRHLYLDIATKMMQEMHAYLAENGTEIIALRDGSTLYFDAVAP